ncbi:hypothetical protein ACFL0C_00925 [Patescibacteria group bacterium]
MTNCEVLVGVSLCLCGIEQGGCEKREYQNKRNNEQEIFLHEFSPKYCELFLWIDLLKPTGARPNTFIFLIAFLLNSTNYSLIIWDEDSLAGIKSTSALGIMAILSPQSYPQRNKELIGSYIFKVRKEIKKRL